MRCDVAVLGGGPAGTATALALRQHGLSVCVLERRTAPAERPGETLAPVARVVLEALGVWAEFLQDGHAPVAGTRSIWGHAVPRETHFLASAYGSGWHLDRRRFELRLQAAARQRGAVLLAGRTLEGASFDGHVWQLDAGAPLEARFCVDASGRGSALARLCGAARVTLDPLVGLTCFLGRRPHLATDPFTLVEAVAGGWWYSAALPDGRLVLAFMTDADLAAASRLATEAGFASGLAMAAHTRARVLDYAPLGAPRVYPAGTSRLQAPVGRGWLAVGDAAASFDPLSSSGIETALRAGLRAADAIAAHLQGDSQALAGYASASTAEYKRYLVERALHYGLERRFGNVPFWRRRQAHVPAEEGLRVAG